MKKLICIATFFIASYAIPTGASGQEVYRCGNAYSQKPCPDAVRVDVQDARTNAQKAEADANTQREATAADAMERARQKEEAQQRAANAKLASAQARKATTKPRVSASTPTEDGTSAATGKTKKKASKKKKQPEFFTAHAAPDKPKAAASAAK